MRVRYLGPLCAGFDHPALEGYDVSKFSPSCYLVEVSEEAGFDGPLIEGDVLVVDEYRVPQHEDLVIVSIEEMEHLFHVFRLGGSLLLIPPRGKTGAVPARWMDLRGVVVKQARQYAI